jgi:hypothetical protein
MSTPQALPGPAAAPDPAAPDPPPPGDDRTRLHHVRIGPKGYFGSSLILIGILPLAPMFAEWGAKQRVGIGTLTVTAAIYAVTVAISSRWLFMFLLGFLIALIETFAFATGVDATPVNNPGAEDFFGMVVTSVNSARPAYAAFTLVIVVSLFISVAIERALRHLKDGEEFFEFIEKGG